eukprot:4443391-Lingulodinium_polyedra.AAC.1
MKIIKRQKRLCATLDQPPRDIACHYTTDARRAYPRGQGEQCHDPSILFPAAALALRVTGARHDASK